MNYLERIFTIIQLLSKGEGSDMKELEQQLSHVSRRQIHSDLEMLAQVGIDIEKDGRRKKITRLSVVNRIFGEADNEVQKHAIELQSAIQKNQRIRLIQYRDHSNFDLEPIKLFDANRRLWAFDCQDRICKQFKLSRFRQLFELPIDCQYQNLYQEPFTDIFGTTCRQGEQVTVSFDMTRLGYDLIRETYPDAYMYVKPIPNNNWICNIKLDTG